MFHRFGHALVTIIALLAVGCADKESEVRREIIFDLEAQADEITPKGMNYKARLVRFISGDQFGEAADWFRKSAEKGYWESFGELSALRGSEELKWNLLSIYGVRVAKESQAIEYPWGGWKNFGDHYSTLNGLISSYPPPINERRSALEKADALVRSLEEIGITFKNDKIAKDEGLTIWADEKERLKQRLGL